MNHVNHTLAVRVRAGVTGKGVNVAVIDSGVEGEGDLTGRVLLHRSFAREGHTDDKYGHGTHVGGIVAGRGTASAPGNGFSVQYTGIAPDAKLLNLRVLNRNGAGRTSDVLAALDWCIKNRDAYAIRIINLSLGHPVFESYTTDPLCRMVESCVWHRIVVVASAGNFGKDTYYILSGTSMAAPVVSGAVALMLEANPSLTPG